MSSKGKPAMSLKTGCLLILSLTLNVVLIYLLVAVRTSLNTSLTEAQRERLQAEMAEIELQWAEKANATPEKREELFRRMRERVGRFLDNSTASSDDYKGTP